MTDIPQPVTLERIARRLVETREEVRSLHAKTADLIEILERIEAKTIVIREEMHAFVEEQRR